MMASPELVSIDNLEHRSSGEGADQIEGMLLKKLKAFFKVAGRNGSSDEYEVLDENDVRGVKQISRNQRKVPCNIPVSSGLKVLTKTKAFLRKAKRKFARRKTDDEGNIRNVDVDVELCPERDAEVSYNGDTKTISQTIETNGPSDKGYYSLALQNHRTLKESNIGGENDAQSGPSEAVRKYFNFHSNRVLKIPVQPMSSSQTFGEDKESVAVESSPQRFGEGSVLGGRQTELTSNERANELTTGNLRAVQQRVRQDDVFESMAETWWISAIEDVQNGNLASRQHVEDASRNASNGSTQPLIAYPLTSDQQLIMGTFLVLVQKVCESFKELKSIVSKFFQAKFQKVKKTLMTMTPFFDRTSRMRRSRSRSSMFVMWLLVDLKFTMMRFMWRTLLVGEAIGVWPF